MKKILLVMMFSFGIATMANANQQFDYYVNEVMYFKTQITNNFTGKLIKQKDDKLEIKIFEDLYVNRNLYAKKDDVIALPIEKIESVMLNNEYVYKDKKVIILNNYNYKEINSGCPKLGLVDNAIKNQIAINKQLGKSLKSSGAALMGLGVPILVTGTILLACGYSTDTYYLYGEKINTYKNTSAGIAGAILFPIGITMTTIGIPLYCTGVKIGNMNAEFSLNFNSNGAGISLVY